MLAGGILAPFLASFFTYVLCKGISDLAFMVIIFLLSLVFCAITVVVATYYWRVTYKMIVQGIKWCSLGIYSIFEYISFSIAGLILYPLTLFLEVGLAAICFAIALGPYLIIPMGGIMLVATLMTKVLPVISPFLTVLLGIANIVSLIVFHFIYPLRCIKNGELLGY